MCNATYTIYIYVFGLNFNVCGCRLSTGSSSLTVIMYVLQVPLTVITDMNEVVQHLPVISIHTDKLIFPPLDS